mgnify:CR=1 FL=1
MALVALRDMPLGDATFAAGEHIPPEVQLALPPGRLEQLKSRRMVEERDFAEPLGPKVEALAEEFKRLAERVEALEAKPAAKPSTRKPKEAKA